MANDTTTTENRAEADAPVDADVRLISFRYTNWKGETSVRTAIPLNFICTSTAWHPDQQWIMYAYDMDRAARRGFALKDCDFMSI